ncbi:MAG TPA: enoyl-CoA hydratase [Mycobacterium sp.]|nr:enoyl-CoA hydratase [Mycobacterium sp.]
MSAADGSAVAETSSPEDAPPAVLYEVRDSGVAILTFNSPERMNAWGGALPYEFFRCIEAAEADPDVRVIVITGNGRAFCAGADMGGLDTISSVTVDSASTTDVSALVAEKHPYFLTQLTKPVIAAINGSVAGMGLSQALMADVRFAAAGAKFTTSFARRGLIAEYGISWILPRLVGWGAAADLLLSGRTFLAEEAVELGLVKEVVPGIRLMDRTLEYAEDMAKNCAPSSLAMMKRQLYADAGLDMVQTSHKAEKLMHDSMQRPDFIEGITAFFQKRPPNFPPLSGPGA